MAIGVERYCFLGAEVHSLSIPLGLCFGLFSMDYEDMFMRYKRDLCWREDIVMISSEAGM